jgi:superfamily II DNA/RNA helicase/5S rRNA maturation endonuclease (ribonuclease M5)
MATKFFTNEGANTLIQKFKGAFENIADLYAFHAVVGYFRASGYFAIRNHLLKVEDVKILVGINVDLISAEAKRRGLIFFGDPDRSKDEFIKWIQQDIKEAIYTKEVEESILNFIEDIINKKIQIKVHKTKKLHAKIYIFLPKKFNEYSGGEVITGSSNLTDDGLGNKDGSNYEFNVALRDYEDVKFAEDEFKKLWDEGEEILPEDMLKVKDKTHIGQLFTPFELYLKFLIEYFGKYIDYDPDSVGDLPSNFKKLSYQIDAVNQGYDMLLKFNGFMLADVVGLGKTVIATMVAKRYLISNGSLNTKILVIYPPHLEQNWKNTFKYFGIDKHAKFISNGSLEKIINNDLNYWPKEDYDLILVDEAHKFRNHTNKMFENLQLICKSERAVIGNVEGDKKKIILISATPLNNRPEDIYYQLQLFTDARKSSLTITNLQSFFAPLIQRYKELLANSRETGKPNITELRKIYSAIREKVLQPITVRRTRTDIESHQDYREDLIAQGIRFPKTADPIAVEYQMDEDLSKLFYHTINYLVDGNIIGYHRYQAIAALSPDVQSKFYENAETISKSLAYIMMTQLVKRLESSFTAFRTSLNNFRTSTERMIQMFEKGKVYVAPDAKVNELMDKGWSDEEIEEKIFELSIENPKNQVFFPTDFKSGFIDDLKKDLKSLTELCEKWELVKDDPKWNKFSQLLKSELFKVDKNPAGKLVIFTESKETSRYLTEQLVNDGYSKILTISAANRQARHNDIQANFDANLDKAKWKEEFNIIISTEVLAEGINLHRANVVINYDTPWNATKLMQRIGRVNRIGSTADFIYNYSFYPSKQSNDLIKLYNNAFIKLQGFHTAYGEDNKIYTVEEVLEEVKLHIKGIPEDEDKRLKYLEFIRRYKQNNPAIIKRIQNMPLKARTARDPNKSENKNNAACSIVYLKSNFKTEFYKILSNGKTEPLNFVEAAEIFEANEFEKPVQLPDFHHEQVQKAINKFHEEMLSNSMETISSDSGDVNSNRAKKFIREFRATVKDEKVKEACNKVYELLDKGTITKLPNELKKLKAKYDKKESSIHQVENIIMQLAVKYSSPSQRETETDIEIAYEVMDLPTIILSETFIN